MAADQATGGYWLVATDGGVFAYNAPFLGSMGGKALNAPMHFMTGTPDFGGYRLVATDGGVFNYGDAQFYGSAAAPGSSGWSALATTTDNGGYWLFAAVGSTTETAFDAFGDASQDLSYVSGDNTSTATVVGSGDPVLHGVRAAPLASAVAAIIGGRDVHGGLVRLGPGCVAVGGTQGGGALIEQSTNGGTSFRDLSLPTGAPAMAGVDCNSAAHCVAVGNTSAMVSSDAGLDWSLVSTPAASGLDSVACENDLDCTAVGGGAGQMASVYSTNGGLSWANSAVARARFRRCDVHRDRLRRRRRGTLPEPG